MAVYKIFPIADTTIYSGYPSMNTGLDEILEVSTNFKTGPTEINGEFPQTSRFLVKFDPTEITSVFSDLIGTSSWASNLRCFNAYAEGLSNTTTLVVNALYQDWSMGSGHYLDSPEIQNGASWVWTNYSGSNKWTTASFNTGTTGSFNTSVNPSSSGGGVWYTGSQASQSFNYYSDLDLNINVTNIVTNWSSSDFLNYGFIVRPSSSQEFINNTNEQFSIKYFSRDTHTIYPPQLEFKWDDSVYNTGSLPLLTTTPSTIVLAENPGVFYSSSINVFRVNSRPTYPPRVWQTGSYYTVNYALPEESYWALKDLDTDEYIIDFDSTYTKLSCDSTGSFFTMYMNGLEPERYYKILIKTTVNNSTIVFDDNYYFKVVNG
jgi:hypothetical protein